MQNPGPQQLFDKRALRRNRARWVEVFARHDALYEETAQSLIERLSFIKRDFKTVLEMHSCNATVAKALLKADPCRTIIRNITPLPSGGAGRGPVREIDKPLPTDNSCPPLYSLPKGGEYFCSFDEEFLPFGENSFDLIISHLGLHWANDVPGALIQARHALKPDGFFIAMLLGGETLQELRASLYEAENELRGGVSPRIAPFMDLRDGAALLQRAGFTLPVADREKYTFTYPDIFALMKELRGMGEAHVGVQKDRRFAPRQLFTRAGEIYRERFPAENGIRASFEVLVLSGWAAHASQQKPLQPGTATQRMAEALGTQEITTPESAPPHLPRKARG